MQLSIQCLIYTISVQFRSTTHGRALISERITGGALTPARPSVRAGHAPAQRAASPAALPSQQQLLLPAPQHSS